MLSGALAINERLHSRGINGNSRCVSCGHYSKTICHVLFTCPLAQEVWSSHGLLLPPQGWSLNSVFLNLHFLMRSSKARSADMESIRSFPWVLWHIWKARNSLLFEQKSMSSSSILDRAREKTDIWFHVNFPITQLDTSQLQRNTNISWKKPELRQM